MTLKVIKKFQIPQPNLHAENWSEVVDFFFGPRIISKISIDENSAAVENPITFPKFPLHSQTVENNVKIVTGITSSVYGEE